MSEMTPEEAAEYAERIVRAQPKAKVAQLLRVLLAAKAEAEDERDSLEADLDPLREQYDSLRGRFARSEAENERLREAVEIGWGVIANACGGNWDAECNLSGWKGAAERWRDEYLPLMRKGEPKETQPPELK